MLGKCLAGILLGAPLSAAVLGLVVWSWPGEWEHVVIPVLLLFFPLWAGVMAAAYMFRNATRAWIGLAAANAIAFVLLWLVRDIAGAI